MLNSDLIAQFQQFRQSLYELFDSYADTQMNLLDALSSNTSAQSVVELSLSFLFRRGYSALFKAISQFFQPQKSETARAERQKFSQALAHLTSSLVPVPQNRPFLLLGLDSTPYARPYARTLPEREYVYQPSPVPGIKPITIGHQYSVLSALLERDSPHAPIWTIPLSSQRVNVGETGPQVGARQVTALMTDPELPFGKSFCVQVEDSSYSTPTFLGQVLQHQNLVTVVRVRRNRVFYQEPLLNNRQRRRGHPLWYGERFDLKDETTWPTPAQTIQTSLITHRGKYLEVSLLSWPNLRMRGTRSYSMHEHPFTLIQVKMTDPNGQRVFAPMWLIVMGNRRHELTVLDSWQSYRQRFDLEHFFRFGKQRLLMTAYQTPDEQNEENWVQLCLLAYAQLFAARKLSMHLPRSWERYLPSALPAITSPTTVQRDFARIIGQTGTPATAPKLRGKSPGRAKGHSVERRQRYPVIKKGKIAISKTPKVA